MRQTGHSVPGSLATQHLEIAAFCRLVMPVLEVEIGADQPSLVAVTHSGNGPQRGIHIGELVELEASMGLQQIEVTRVRQLLYCVVDGRDDSGQRYQIAGNRRLLVEPINAKRDSLRIVRI